MSSQKELAEYLKQIGVLKSPHLIKAFNEIDRRDFVLPDFKNLAYLDEALPIGMGQTISQPYTVAFMLELLNPQPGEKIMDIGAGSGWQTSLLANVVGLNGKVFAFEIVPELCEFGTKNIAKYNFLKKGIVEWHCESAEGGLPEKAPFDKIIAAAALEDKIPESWLSQLKFGGCVIAPIKESVWRYAKNTDGSFGKEEYPGFLFVPFIKENEK
jgi:protein-L-isoaspartate(D-aspartate) O-methyltransferase